MLLPHPGHDDLVGSIDVGGEPACHADRSIRVPEEHVSIVRYRQSADIEIQAVRVRIAIPGELDVSTDAVESELSLDGNTESEVHSRGLPDDGILLGHPLHEAQELAFAHLHPM